MKTVARSLDLKRPPNSTNSLNSGPNLQLTEKVVLEAGLPTLTSSQFHLLEELETAVVIRETAAVIQGTAVATQQTVVAVQETAAAVVIVRRRSMDESGRMRSLPIKWRDNGILAFVIIWTPDVVSDSI